MGSDVYELHRHKWEFFGKRDFRKTMLLSLDGEQWMSGSQKVDLMKSMVSEKEQRQMDKMLKMGYSHEDVVNHFIEEAERKSGSSDLRKKMDAAIKDQKDLSDEEMLEMIKSKLGDDSIKQMEKLIKEGHSIKDVINKMMDQGSTKEEELLEKAETLSHLLKSKKKNIRISESEAESMMDEMFDDDMKEKIHDMMKSGASLKKAIKNVIDTTKPKEQLTNIEKRIKELSDGKELSQYQMYELLKD